MPPRLFKIHFRYNHRRTARQGAELQPDEPFRLFLFVFGVRFPIQSANGERTRRKFSA